MGFYEAFVGRGENNELHDVEDRIRARGGEIAVWATDVFNKLFPRLKNDPAARVQISGVSIDWCVPDLTGELLNLDSVSEVIIDLPNCRGFKDQEAKWKKNPIKGRERAFKSTLGDYAKDPRLKMKR